MRRASPSPGVDLGPAVALKSPWQNTLIAAASAPYRKAGLFAYFFARGKFGTDPVYRAILERGLLLGRAHILDLGCGQSLLTMLLKAALQMFDRGDWPPAWPAAPRPASVRGIELMPRDVRRARCALGPDTDIVQGDIRTVEFGSVDAVVMFDVLHYMGPEAQRDVLGRVRRALPERGLLLLRVSDAGAGLRHRYTKWVDKIVMRARGHAFVAAHCRSVPEWRSLLTECGFDSETLPMSEGTPFANVLLIAHAR